MIPVIDIILYVSYFILLFLSIFWLLVLFTVDEEEIIPVHRTELPFFSVIIPAHNEERSIIGTLESAVQLDYPAKKIEIIVVNNASTDNTALKVQQFMAEHPAQDIKLVCAPEKGKGRAMNHGLRLARGDFFACLDADSFIGKNALQAMLPLFDEHQTVAAVCPMMKVRAPNSVLQKVQWCEYIINMFYRFLNAKINCIHVTPGPFSIYRTEIIRNLGGYDENTITEDLEIAVRLQKHNYKIVQTFDAVVETIAPNTWNKLFQQRVRWYKGSVDNVLYYRKLMFNKKYGDFGMVRMPTIILSGIMVIILTVAFFQQILKSVYHSFFALKDVHFDILTLIQNISFDVNLLNLPLFKMFIAATIMGISFFVMYYSYKIINEKITSYGRTWVSLFTYLSVYSLFIAVVWMYIAVIFVTKKKDRW